MILQDNIMEALSHIVSTYPPGLIEISGIITTQLFMIIVTGLYCYYTASSQSYRDVLLSTVPVTARNFAAALSFNFLILQFMSWKKDLGFLGYSMSEVGLSNVSLQRVVREFMISVLVYELIFYVGHRSLHHPRIYKKIHAVHHAFELKYKEHVPFSAFYSHVIEFIFSYGLIEVGTVLQRAHVVTLYSCGIAATAGSMYLHCGKDIPGMIGHEIHHFRPSFNYGSTGLMDYTWGTLWVDKQQQRSSKTSISRVLKRLGL